MFWKKNNKIVVDSQGRPISCSECPCGSVECEDAVDSEVQRLLALVDEHGHNVWSLQGTYEPPYRCAEWHYDSENEEWVLDHMAEGKLAVALRVGTKVSHTTDCVARFLVYAKTLYSASLEQWLTVGCECHVSDHVCKHRKVSLSDFAVAGLLDVWQPDESDSGASYEPSDTCRVDTCDLAKLKLQSAHEWHYGGTLYGEGFYDWWSSTTHTQSYYHFTKFLKGLYWNDFEIEESDSETITIDHWKFTYIPCDCDSQYPVHHELAENDKIHEYNGICDMESTCQNQVLFTLRSYLDSGDWEEVASVATDFVCAVYEGDTCVIPSSGNLCMAYSRPATLGYGTAISSGAVFVTATTLYNSTTGVYRTVGCRCYAGTWRYPECSQQFADLEGVCIGGVLPVAPDNCDRNACATYPCDDYALQWACYAEWYGCTLYGEGYLQKGTGFTNYTKFSMALQGINNNVPWYAYVDCGCSTGHTGSRYSDELPSTWSLHELSGLCSNPECEQLLILMQQAQEQGWTMYGEGILVHLAKCDGSDVFGDWYVYEGSSFKACADAGDKYYVVSCGCSVSEVDKLYYPSRPVDPVTNPADYATYIEYEGACTCVDRRELYLTYPDVFGIVDVSYGNHSKYRYTSSYYDHDEGRTVTSTGVSFCSDTAQTSPSCEQGQMGGYRTLTHNFIEYRSFCYAYKVLTDSCQQKVKVGRIDPQGSYAGSWSNSNTYDSVEFIGHLEPFAVDPDTNFTFGGQVYYWYPEINLTWWEWFSTQREAQELCNSSTPTPPVNPQPYDVCHGQPEFGQRISPPVYTTTLKPCKFDTRTDQWGETEYGCRPAYYGVGVEVSEDSWCMYREQYIETNKGWLRYGVSGYVPQFLLYGVHGDPVEEWEQGICYNQTLVAHVDEDMHGCDPDFEWDFDEDSESQSESSESINVSQGE